MYQHDAQRRCCRGPHVILARDTHAVAGRLPSRLGGRSRSITVSRVESLQGPWRAGPQRQKSTRKPAHKLCSITELTPTTPRPDEEDHFCGRR